MHFHLLFVLPDRKNQAILAIKREGTYQFPAYEKPIEDQAGSAIPQLDDIPQPYNDYFKNLTGITVFRKYVLNTKKNVVFVCEQVDEMDHAPTNEYSWVSYDAFFNGQPDDEMQEIAKSVRRDDHKHHGFAPYLAWLGRVCAHKNIRIGDIAQIKSEWVFRVSCDIGDLYLKIVGDTHINELIYTRKLMEAGIPNLPEWVAYAPELNAFLMRDMGGGDLSSQSEMKMEDLQNLVVTLSSMQKASIPYIQSADFYGYNYRIGTTIHELKNFPEDAYDMLSGTPYEITLDEKKRLTHNTGCVIAILTSINNTRFPDTLHNSDMAAYNIRLVDEAYIFYDWAWGGASHPFFNLSRLLNTIKRMLPTNIPAKDILVEVYLREWSDYGNPEELQNVFTAVDRLLGFNVMFFLKYIRTKHLHLSMSGTNETVSADGRALDKRYQNFALYLKRFIEEAF